MADQIGNWNQVKSDLRKKWGQLTDEELEQTHGDLTQLEGLMQTKYGYQREEARKHLQNFLRPYGSDEPQTTSTSSSRSSQSPDEREANAEGFAGGSDGSNNEQVTGGGETSTSDPMSVKSGSVGAEGKTPADVNENQNEDEREIGAHYSSTTGGQMPKSSTTGGKFSSESQTRGSTQREQAIASAQESEDGRARQELGQHGMGSKNPDREKNSDEFDAHVGQDNKPNNKDQFTKPEARH